MLKGWLTRLSTPPEALRKRKPAQLADDALGVTFIALHHHRNHAAGQGHLLARQLMMRVRGQPGKPDSLHFRLLFQPFGELQRVRAVALHPQRRGYGCRAASGSC